MKHTFKIDGTKFKMSESRIDVKYEDGTELKLNFFKEDILDNKVNKVVLSPLSVVDEDTIIINGVATLTNRKTKEIKENVNVVFVSNMNNLEFWSTKIVS